MRLTCPGCHERALARPPTTDQPPGRPVPPYSHTDGTPLCPTVYDDGYRPYWPDDHDPHRVIPTIAPDTLALPKHHPCRAHGTVPAPLAQATVFDKHGGINCPATIAAGHCPYATAGMLEHNEGGLQDAGCWLRAAAPQAIIVSLHQAGTPPPHRINGFAHRHLDHQRIQALLDWLFRHRYTYLDDLPTQPPADAAAILRQTIAWLGHTDRTTGGLYTLRRAELAALRAPAIDPPQGWWA